MEQGRAVPMLIMGVWTPILHGSCHRVPSLSQESWTCSCQGSWSVGMPASGGRANGHISTCVSQGAPSTRRVSPDCHLETLSVAIPQSLNLVSYWFTNIISSPCVPFQVLHCILRVSMEERPHSYPVAKSFPDRSPKGGSEVGPGDQVIGLLLANLQWSLPGISSCCQPSLCCL